jgi:hypothetical protein
MEETMKTSLSMTEEGVPAASHAQTETSRYRWVVLAVVWAAFLLS